MNHTHSLIPTRCYQLMLETTTRSIPIALFNQRQGCFDLAQLIGPQPTKQMMDVFGYDNDVGLRVSMITLVHSEPVEREVLKVFAPEMEVLQCSQASVGALSLRSDLQPGS